MTLPMAPSKSTTTKNTECLYYNSLLLLEPIATIYFFINNVLSILCVLNHSKEGLSCYFCHCCHENSGTINIH